MPPVYRHKLTSDASPGNQPAGGAWLAVSVVRTCAGGALRDEKSVAAGAGSGAPGARLVAGGGRRRRPPLASSTSTLASSWSPAAITAPSCTLIGKL